ncbi:sigma-E factor negative regulatory protein [Arenimonas oryziterrae]|uniref:Anti sigma-E protein RseA N-terminal domain-containing protein n=1 Tax=Arenimonas oryziterrae DSM 21050 = YC6267 TaxID=1121015 RepID=A0A091AP39_9GAMM|nr:RseA family anti-sigma factor [Arenimonas oryziterrae]KFN41141.1 hypothetical protein N789_04445 [Arenimonas oryziterrae DSM 21050 = YC6267]
MTTLDQTLREQLSAYMDGELTADEARFLERRLANEPPLRALWERMQVASSCLKGQPLRPMRATLPDDIAAALAVEAAPSRRAWRPLIAWAVAASVGLLALALVPQWLGAPATPATVPVADVQVPVVPALPVNATPASADLVAVDSTDATSSGATVEVPVATDRGTPAPPTSSAPVVASTGGQSPADFPLVEAAGSKAWPRSPLSGASNDPALEAYLVRHNQMMSDDGLSGFVPYVDVVANDPNAANQDDNGDAKQ